MSKTVDFSEETFGRILNEELQTLMRLLSQLESQSTTTVSSNFIKSSTTFIANNYKSL